MNTPDPNAKPQGFAKLIGWIVLLAFIGLAALIVVPKLMNKEAGSNVESPSVSAPQPEVAPKKPTFDTR